MKAVFSKFSLTWILIIFQIVPTISQEIEKEIKPNNISLSFNGIFTFISPFEKSKVHSPNGQFWCQYDIGNVGDEVRELINFRFYENNQPLFTLKKAPGSDLYISNSGYIAFMDLTRHYKSELTIHFYSKFGQYLFSETFVGASLFGFSSRGNKFGVGNVKYLNIISILDHQIEPYNGGYQFDISEDENLVAIAMRERARVYSNKKLLNEFKTGFLHTRKIKISSKYNIVAAIDKKNLKVYSLLNDSLLFADKLKSKNSYRDLIFERDKILTGIHYRYKGVSKGILKAYDFQGKVLLEKEQAVKKFKTFNNQKKLQKSSLDYRQIPWPFVPFDSLHTVWNYYEQHMSYGNSDWSYLHQGLDIIVPDNEPTYAVEPGIVKCVLTISAYLHWRLATSKEQTDDYFKGWLYAHLVPTTIQFDVGDTVEQFDYLGDIVHWAEDWGHIHFVEIEDSGWVWQYDDNEWGITYNPLLSLRPNTDLIPPIIDNVFSNSKFGFCLNETSTYLDPDSLFGDIDIIVKVIDYIDDSPWQLPAYETYYWVKKLPGSEIVFPKKLGHILNHAYNFYSSDSYTPYATVIYKRDDVLLPPLWMERQRNYYQVLTNSDGDSLINLWEQAFAFSTSNYDDGDYRILVEAKDQYGNSTIDSMDVKFKNGISAVSKIQESVPLQFKLMQNYPNPFNPTTNIQYSIPESGNVKLTVYDVLGRELVELVNQFQKAGIYSVAFHAEDFSSGIYFYKLKTGEFSAVRKMVLME